MKLKRLQELNVKGRRVLVRVDYNVPLEGDKIVDATRIRETVPTLKHLIDGGAKVALISHSGRPKGKPAAKYSLKPVDDQLSKLLCSQVRFGPDCVGESAEKAVASLKDGDVALLENLRFQPGEESNDPDFSKNLAKLGDLFVQDAFGALHRAYASTAGIPKS